MLTIEDTVAKMSKDPLINAFANFRRHINAVVKTDDDSIESLFKNM